MIYKITDGELDLARIGTHAELLKKYPATSACLLRDSSFEMASHQFNRTSLQLVINVNVRPHGILQTETVFYKIGHISITAADQAELTLGHGPFGWLFARLIKLWVICYISYFIAQQN